MNANLRRNPIVVKSPETFVETEIVSNWVLPSEANRFLSEVWKPFPDAHVDVIETDSAAGVRENRQHDQFLVAKTWFMVFWDLNLIILEII